MAMNGRERILAALEGRETDSLPLMPITMMFAGDLIGVPYRDYATDYRVLAEGQVRTAEAFDFDYVSCISDPAREAADCGAAVHIFADQPPAIDERSPRVRSQGDLAGLTMPDPLAPGRMHGRVKAAALLRERIGHEKLVEGWIEGPCAEAADLAGINSLMTFFYEDPMLVQGLLEFVLELGLRFAKAQVDAGVDLIGVGDAAASLVGPDIYREYVWPFEKRLVDGLHDMGTRVRLHICGDTRPILEDMGRLGCEIVDLDSMVPLDQARAAMGPDQVLLGNLDPVAILRNGSPESVQEALAECHRQAGPRYIVGAGCEIPRDTPHENVRALTEYARGHGASPASSRATRDGGHAV